MIFPLKHSIPQFAKNDEAHCKRATCSPLAAIRRVSLKDGAQTKRRDSRARLRALNHFLRANVLLSRPFSCARVCARVGSRCGGHYKLAQRRDLGERANQIDCPAVAREEEILRVVGVAPKCF